MIGITALAYTIGHIIIYCALRFWNFEHIAQEMLTRLSLILATAATIGLIALGATSLDAAVRRMGAKGWNRLHAAIYLIAALALIHYLLSPDMYPDQFLTSGIFLWLMLWRILNRRGYGTDATMLAVLAVVSSLLTVFLEAGWTWVYHGYEPIETLADNFSLVLGVSPAWKILLVGLLVAVAAAVRPASRLRAVVE
jgi:sulfoxide reductase heme-binding subunit YedZ